MTGWLLPGVAAAVWTGILASGVGLAGGSLPPWLGIVLGAAGLAAAVALAPRLEALPGPLRAAVRQRDRSMPSLEAVEAPRPVGARGPPGLPAVVAVVAAAVLGWGWAGVRAGLDARAVRQAAEADGRSVTVVGVLREDPRAGPYGWVASVGVAELRVDGTSGASRPGWTLLLEGEGDPPEAVRWDRVQADGRISAAGPGGVDPYLGRAGAHARLRVSAVSRLGPSHNPLLRSVQWTRSVLRSGILERFPEREAGLLLGLALGDLSLMHPAVEEDFRATGLGHLLAVSGQNVAMVLAPVIGLAVLLRLSPRGQFGLGAATVLFFVLLTGAEPSVLRAGVMAAVTLAGGLAGRPRSSPSALGGAVLVLLLADPRLAAAVGFQLSVAATAGLLLLAGPLTARLSALPRPVAIALATSLAAQAGVAPLLLLHFHLVPLVAIPANLLAFPAVAPALLLGLAGAGLGRIVEPIGTLLAAPALPFLQYLEALADGLATAPLASITSGRASIATLAVGFGALATLAVWLRSGRPLPRRAIVAAATVLPLLVWTTALGSGPPAGLVVRFFDVGQGDAALITTPDGANVLIDAGPDRQQVATALAGLGVKRLDLVVATHPHADHVEGFPAVLARFRVALLVEPGCPEDSPSYDALLRSIEEEDVPVRHPRAGEVITVGELRVEVLSPSACFRGTASDPNNDSLVLRISYREDVVLFPGDAEEPAQELLLDEGAPLTAPVLKVPHHGGGTSLDEFLLAVDPGIAVVSVGDPNDYGHPVPSIIELLEGSGAVVLRTDLVGDVVVRFLPDGRPVASAAS